MIDRGALAATAAGVLVFIVMGKASALGVHDGRLAPCPDSPNCVSSDAQGDRYVAPLRLKGSPQAAWQALERLLARTPRVEVLAVTPDYLHAQFVSRVFRFKDDVEFQLRPADRVIAVRSASRVGYSDFGANRSRVERLRGELRSEGVVD